MNTIVTRTSPRHCDTISSAELMSVLHCLCSAGAGGVRTAEGVDQKRGEDHSAVAVLAVLFSLVVLAALGYLARQLLKKKQE